MQRFHLENLINDRLVYERCLAEVKTSSRWLGNMAVLLFKVKSGRLVHSNKCIFLGVNTESCCYCMVLLFGNGLCKMLWVI